MKTSSDVVETSVRKSSWKMLKRAPKNISTDRQEIVQSTQDLFKEIGLLEGRFSDP